MDPIYAYVLGDALYFNITNGCTLRCRFCPKIRERNFQVGGHNLKLMRPPTVPEIWDAAIELGLEGRSEVVFTGFGEPTTRLATLLELTRRLKSAGVERVRVDTDGLANLRTRRDIAPELAQAGIDAVSVSLNAPNPATYAFLCPSAHGEAAWYAACAFLTSARAVIGEVTATAVGVPGLSESECRAVASELGVNFRLRPFDTIGRTQGPH